MKTKNKKTEKEFDTVKTFREIKEEISNELIGKTTDQILEYLKLNSLKLQTEKQHCHQQWTKALSDFALRIEFW